MDRPLLCLTMIVRDEAHCIQQTLDSVKSFVDRWAILDTGSKDGTQAVIREGMRGIPGYFYEQPFVDFATSRNQVLDLAGVIDAGPESVPVFTLMLSADETLHGGQALRTFLEAHRGAGDGAYSVALSAEHARWFYPRILRVDAGWRYVGEVHEVPLGPNRETHGPIIPDVVVTHAATDPQRRSTRLRNFDLPVLTKMVADETRPLFERAQAVWFLAQTYDGLADQMERVPGGDWVTYKTMAMSLYWRRVELGGMLGEADDTLKTHYAVFRFLNVAEKIGFYTSEELLTRLNAFVEIDARIPEMHYVMAVHAAKLDVRQGLFFAEQAARAAREAFEQPPSHLPVDVRLEWLALKIGAACAEQLGRSDYARELAERAVAAGGPRTAFEEYLALREVSEMNVDTPLSTAASDVVLPDVV